LVRLTQQSLDLELSRSKNRAQSCPNFNGIQKCAQNLYDTLISGLQCAVVGCTGHGAELRLENRTMKDKTDKALLERTTFRVMLASNSVKRK
jgi:methyl coenzyme M reductase gamma subunit